VGAGLKSAQHPLLADDEYFPEHRGKRLIPVFSSLTMSDDLANYLSKQGVYAMGMGDETMDLVNADRLRNREPSTI